ELLPALVGKDVHLFGRTLYEFNQMVAATFAPLQGGVYAHPRIAELVDFLRSKGVQGVGQSSWGPAVFALAANERRAITLAARIQEQLGIAPADVIVAKPLNRGAEVSQ